MYFQMAQKFLKFNLLIPNAYRLTTLFDFQYPKEILAITSLLNSIPSKINLVCDGWTDSSFHHYFGKSVD